VNAEKMQRFCDCLRLLPNKKESFDIAVWKICGMVGLRKKPGGKSKARCIILLFPKWMEFDNSELEDFAEFTEELSRTLKPPEIAKYLEYFYLGEELI
jgi:hypothetical protein